MNESNEVITLIPTKMITDIACKLGIPYTHLSYTASKDGTEYVLVNTKSGVTYVINICKGINDNLCGMIHDEQTDKTIDLLTLLLDISYSNLA